LTLSESERVRARLNGPREVSAAVAEKPRQREAPAAWRAEARTFPAPRAVSARRNSQPQDLWYIPQGAWSGEAAVILGGGPSLKQDAVPRLRGRARVIAVNTAYILAPWADVLFAPDSRWWNWHRNRLHEFQGGAMVSRQQVRGIEGVKRIGWARGAALSRDPSMVAGVCGGGGALNIAYQMGANPIILMGFDMRPGNWHDLHKLPHVEGQHRDKFIPALERMAVELERDGVTVLNTNPRSALRCFPFANIEELLMHDDLARIEADKYRRVWERPEYRRVSPGQLECERALAVFGAQAGESLIDYGSGPARATKWFANKGLSVTGVDIAPNAAETDVPVVEACLWDLPADLGPSDYAYCCDVMEHIPQQQVDAVITGIRERTRGGAYWRIATRPDVMGKRLLGEPLHLTVKPADWWRRRFETYWPLVDVVEDTGRDLVLYTQV